LIKENILKGKITEKQTTYKRCGEAIGVTKNTFTCKINNQTSFTTKQATELSNYLELSLEERCTIFLT